METSHFFIWKYFQMKHFDIALEYHPEDGLTKIET